MGGDVKNHVFGPDLAGRGIRWRFVLGCGAERDHRSSPGMDRIDAVRGAKRLAVHDMPGARQSWGKWVCLWLDALPADEHQGLMAAAREIGEAFNP